MATMGSCKANGCPKGVDRQGRLERELCKRVTPSEVVVPILAPYALDSSQSGQAGWDANPELEILRFPLGTGVLSPTPDLNSSGQAFEF